MFDLNLIFNPSYQFSLFFRGIFVLPHKNSENIIKQIRRERKDKGDREKERENHSIHDFSTSGRLSEAKSRRRKIIVDEI